MTQNISLYDPVEGVSSSVDVENIDDNLYELKSNHPFSDKLTYGTVVQTLAQRDDDGSLVLDRIVRQSNYRMEVYGIANGLQEAQLRTIGDKVIKAGGYWEVMFGGIAWVNLPKDSTLDVNKELKQLIQNTIQNKHA